MACSSSPSKQSSSSSSPPKMSSLILQSQSLSELQNPNQSQNPNSAAESSEKGKAQQGENNQSSSLKSEVLRRRSDNLKELANCYKDHMWSMMEDVRVQFRDYTWKYGAVPFQNADNNDDEDNEIVMGLCSFNGCRYKAMDLTQFCHAHILSDPRQMLYKPCKYVVKSTPAGDITCGRPILQATMPSHCNTHKVKAQYHLIRALKKAGLNVGSSEAIAPRVDVLAIEYVRAIQTKRKVVFKAKQKKRLITIKELI